MYHNILIATDGSDYASCAVEHGLELAKVINAQVLIVTVTEPCTDPLSAKDVLAYSEIEYDAEMNERALHTLAAVAVRAKAIGVACKTIHVRDQEPADGIVKTATEHGCDLIVMASHGRRGLQRLILGSQTHRVLTKTTLPVLVCR